MLLGVGCEDLCDLERAIKKEKRKDEKRVRDDKS
jgi:hypothetical protein